MGYGNVFGVPAKWACAANTNRVVQGSFKDFIDGLIYFVWSGFEINTAFTTVHHCFIPSYGILYEPAEEYHTSQHARTRLKCYCASGANLYKWMQNGISIVWLTLTLVPPFVAVFSIGSTLSSKLLSNTDSSGPMSGYPNRQRSERKWKITFLASFVAAANFLLMFATAGANTHLNKAEAEVERSLELMTAGKLVEIYSESTDELRLATSEKEFTDPLSAVRRKLGQFKFAERTNWFINYNTAGRTSCSASRRNTSAVMRLNRSPTEWTEKMSV